MRKPNLTRNSDCNAILRNLRTLIKSPITLLLMDWNATMLTEEKLLKMSEDDYMNEQQTAFFEGLLQENRKELMETIQEARDGLADNEVSSDPSDIATKQEMQQVYLRTVERQSKLLRKVEQALDRIRNGEYGYCEETGEPIGIPRLLARPTATMSIQAKEAQEYHEKTEGGE